MFGRAAPGDCLLTVWSRVDLTVLMATQTTSLGVARYRREVPCL